MVTIFVKKILRFKLTLLSTMQASLDDLDCKLLKCDPRSKNGAQREI